MHIYLEDVRLIRFFFSAACRHLPGALLCLGYKVAAHIVLCCKKVNCDCDDKPKVNQVILRHISELNSTLVHPIFRQGQMGHK